jgi:hypothetical protein
MMRCYISYRPEDKGFVARMRFGLQKLLPELEVRQSNPQGNNESIASIIENVDAVLVVIGAGWLRSAGASNTFLASPDDYVRHELTAALNNPHIRIAPLLLDDARMPGKDVFPTELRAFATVAAATIKGDSFEADLQRAIEMLRTPDDESSWFPTVEYGTVQIRCNQGGLVKRYLETEHTPVTIMIDGEDVGAMHLINKTFEQKLTPGEHVVALRSGDIPVRRCECRVFVRQGQTSVLRAERNWFVGTLSLRSDNKS